MARRRRRSSTSQRIASIATVALPGPLRAFFSTRIGSFLFVVGFPLLLLTGILSIEWSGGRPHFRFNRDRAKEVRTEIGQEIQNGIENKTGFRIPQLPGQRTIVDPTDYSANSNSTGTGYSTPAGTYPSQGYPAAGYNQPYSQPGFSQPGFSQPGFSQPGYSPPGYSQPGSTQPVYPPPGTTPPGYSQPGYPGYSPPNYSTPGYQPPYSSGYPQPSYPSQGYAAPGYAPVDPYRR